MNKGFTLVELMITISMIGIVGIILFSLFSVMNEKKFPSNKFQTTVIEIEGRKYIRDCVYNKLYDDVYELQNCSLVEIKE
jgi:prepilin-type N-terminal cleavage/methylation domain-containing protein